MANFYAFYPPSGGSSSANASVGLNGVTAPTSSTEVAGVNPSGNLQPLQTDASGNLLTLTTPATGSVQHVIVDSSALPTGAATQTTLATVSTTLGSILLDMTNGTQITQVSNFPATQPVSGTVTVVQPTGTNLHTVIDSSALPTNASTSALQTTGNTSLASIDSKTPALGQQLAAASSPVVLTAAQLTTLTPLTSVAVTQATAANLNATVVGTGTFAVQAAQSGAYNITNITGTVSLPTGAATSANQTNGTQQAKITDGTNLATIKAASTASVTTDTSLVVAISPNSNTVRQAGTATSAITSVSGSVTTVQLLASNAARKGAAFYNDSASVLYLKLGVTASTTSYTVQLVAGAYYELPTTIVYTGEIDGIWTSAVGAVRITELS